MNFFKIAYGDEEPKSSQHRSSSAAGTNFPERPTPEARREENATRLRIGKRKAVERFLAFEDPERVVEKWRER